MKHNIFKRIKQLSIKWHVFLYLLLFAGVIILILWLCQVAFLDRIYKAVKISEIKDSALRITANINSEELGVTIDDIAANHNICVTVLQMENDNNAVTLYSHHTFNSCVIHSIGTDSIFALYDNAKANSGTNLQRFMYDAARRKYIGIEGDFFDNSQLEEYRGKFPESIIYSVITSNSAGKSVFILLNSEISPIEATVNTLNKILLFITVIFVALALLLAALISHRVSKPIEHLTRSARELAKGNYDVDFSEKGYKEVSQLSDALDYAQKELSRVDTLRRELIANISHDLRTPLTMIGGYSEIMRDIPGENTPENVQVIIDETKRLSSLVDDVLDISKLESGVGTLKKEVYNLTESIEALLLRFSKLCEQDGYTIEFFCDSNAYVNADEKRITQVIYNLLGNAVTHTGKNKDVTLRQSINGGWIRIEVSDSGEGIPADKLPLIWDRYYKVDRVHKRAAIGTGLGLSIVKTIMEQSGGKYGVTSAVGSGSTFFIELPLDHFTSKTTETEQIDEQ